MEETLKRIQSQKGVQGIIVVNSEGIPIKSTIDNATTIQYAGLMHSFIMKARSTVRDIDPQNDLTFLRIRSKKNEIMVAPDKDYFLIVIQNPTEWLHWLGLFFSLCLFYFPCFIFYLMVKDRALVLTVLWLFSKVCEN